MHAIDTNVWIYSQDIRDKDKQKAAQDIIAVTRPLALPWQVGCEFIAASRKLTTFGFSAEQAWQSLEAMQALADVILMPSTKHWSICSELVSNYKISFWDGMLIASCIEGGVKTLFTEDLTEDSIVAGVRIVNPFRKLALE